MGTSSLSWPIEEPADPQELASEHLLPAQFTELLHRSSERTPELKLMGAVIEDAIRCFCQCAGSPGVRSQRLFRETAEWFESRDVSWPFAFDNLCEALALEPDWIRGLSPARESIHHGPFRSPGWGPGGGGIGRHHGGGGGPLPPGRRSAL